MYSSIGPLPVEPRELAQSSLLSVNSPTPTPEAALHMDSPYSKIAPPFLVGVVPTLGPGPASPGPLSLVVVGWVLGWVAVVVGVVWGWMEPSGPSIGVGRGVAATAAATVSPDNKEASTRRVKYAAAVSKGEVASRAGARPPSQRAAMDAEVKPRPT